MENLHDWVKTLCTELITRVEHDKLTNNRIPTLLTVSLKFREKDASGSSKALPFLELDTEKMVENIMQNAINLILKKKPFESISTLHICSSKFKSLSETIKNTASVNSFFTKLGKSEIESNTNESTANDVSELINDDPEIIEPSTSHLPQPVKRGFFYRKILELSNKKSKIY